MVLDTSRLGPVGPPWATCFAAAQAKKIILDHHVSQDDLGAEAFKDTTAEATGRLVVEAAAAPGRRAARPTFARRCLPRWRPIPAGFVCLDHGDTYRAAAATGRRRRRPEAIYHCALRTRYAGAAAAAGRMLARTQTELGGRLVHTSVGVKISTPPAPALRHRRRDQYDAGSPRAPKWP